MKTWQIEMDPDAFEDLDDLDDLDLQVRQKIHSFLNRLPSYPSPRRIGEALQGNRKGLWRYRVGDYRVICEILEDRLVILVVAIGHRRDVDRTCH